MRWSSKKSGTKLYRFMKERSSVTQMSRRYTDVKKRLASTTIYRGVI